MINQGIFVPLSKEEISMLGKIALADGFENPQDYIRSLIKKDYQDMKRRSIPIEQRIIEAIKEAGMALTGGKS